MPEILSMIQVQKMTPAPAVLIVVSDDALQYILQQLSRIWHRFF